MVSQGRVWFLEGRGLVSQGRVWFLEGRGWSRKVGFRVKRSGKLMVLGLRGLTRWDLGLKGLSRLGFRVKRSGKVGF